MFERNGHCQFSKRSFYSIELFLLTTDRKAQDWLSEYPEVVEKLGRGLDKHTPETTRNTAIVCSTTSGQQLCLLYSVVPISTSTEQQDAQKAQARTNGAVAIFQPQANLEAAQV